MGLWLWGRQTGRLRGSRIEVMGCEIRVRVLGSRIGAIGKRDCDYGAAKSRG